MKVTDNMIRPELRLRGKIADKILGSPSEDSFRKRQDLMRKFSMNMKPKDFYSEARTITTRNGRSLRICIYSAFDTKKNAAGLLWIHGGGYAIGTPEQDISFIRRFIKTSNCVVVAPDYTLSVDEPYPAALEDCYEALYWMKTNAKELGMRDDQLFIGGDSAGGGLTAATTLYARDKKEVNIAFQMPLYPMIDDRMKSKSMQDNDAPVWNEARNIVGWRMYLGDLYGTEQVPKYAAPIRETDYSNLPPAYTFVGSIDPFCDETRAYILRLQKAGVEADCKVYKGCYHGFEIFNAGTDIAKKANKELMEAFDYALNHYFAEQDN